MSDVLIMEIPVRRKEGNKKEREGREKTEKGEKATGREEKDVEERETQRERESANFYRNILVYHRQLFPTPVKIQRKLWSMSQIVTTVLSAALFIISLFWRQKGPKS